MSGKTLFAALLAVALAAPAFAQDSGGRHRDRSSTDSSSSSSSSSDQGGRRGGFDMSRFTDMIKDRMGATDDEWKVIQPKLEKVMTLRNESRGGFFGSSRRSSESSSSSDANRSPMQQASKDLREILDKKDATPEEINAKLTAFREARDKSRQQLVTAQKDLKDVLSARQEAVLVSMGMLD